MTWSNVHKVASVLLPFVILWCVWLSREAIINEQFRASGERFTKADGYKISKAVTALETKISREIVALETRQEIILQNQIRMLGKIDQLTADWHDGHSSSATYMMPRPDFPVETAKRFALLSSQTPVETAGNHSIPTPPG